MVPGGFFDWSKWMDTELYDLGLGACFLGFALFTHSLHYIYTRWSLSACSCSLHTLSPSPDLNKTSLASLSLPSLLVKEPAGSVRREGKEAQRCRHQRGRESTTDAAVHFYPAAACFLLHNLLLVDVVGPPSAEVCRTIANFPQVDDLRFINP